MRLLPRCSTQAPAASAPYIIIISDADPSTIEQSMTWPLPVARALTMPARTPIARYSAPPPKSPIRLSGGTGGPPAGPIEYSAPDSAM